MLTPRRAAGDLRAWLKHSRPITLSKIVSAFSEHVNVGAFVLPADVTPSRLGPEPPDSFPLLRDRLENAMYAWELLAYRPLLSARTVTGTCTCENRFGKSSTFPGAETAWLALYGRGTPSSEARPSRRPRLFRAAGGRHHGQRPRPRPHSSKLDSRRRQPQPSWAWTMLRFQHECVS